MGREKTGSIRVKNGKAYARITYKDEAGKTHEMQRIAPNRTEANKLKRQLLRELEEHGKDIIQGSAMTFEQLAKFYEETYVIQPKYVKGRKVAGLRSQRQVTVNLNTVKKHFGKQKIRSIKFNDLEQYKLTRLDTKKDPKKADSQTLSIGYVNRELALIRRLFTIAQQQGWITKNPFASGTGLISAADETKRERILTKEEELRLLEACTGKSAHLRAVIICAVDTGMRAGEIFKLKWDDINFLTDTIVVQAFNTKTMKERTVAITTRLKRELLVLAQKAKDQKALVFGIETNCKKAFGTARKLAGLDDVRFHDLRHTAATRMIQGGLPLQEVGRILGHTQANTTYRYVNANADTAKRAGLALEAFWEEATDKEKDKDELVN